MSSGPSSKNAGIRHRSCKWPIELSPAQSLGFCPVWGNYTVLRGLEIEIGGDRGQ